MAPGSRSPKGDDFSGKQFWNATDVCCDFGRSQVDDVGYLKRLVDVLAARYRVDRKRIYLIGQSNGGFMANRLACEAGQRFAAIVSFAGGSFKNVQDCRKPMATPYLQIHGVDDRIVSYGEEQRYAGAMPTVRQWLARNGCMARGETSERRQLLPLVVGPEVDMKVWKNCRSGRPVELWTLQPFDAPFYNPHLPIPTWSFAEEILDFLFEQKLH
jgi:polyhydroxybutyrate depolymerase